jgi:hypothetical protein
MSVEKATQLVKERIFPIAQKKEKKELGAPN